MLRYRFTSTDKLTGHTMALCAEGVDQSEAAERIWELGFVMSSCKPCPWEEDPTLKPKMDPEWWAQCVADPEWPELGISAKRLIGKVYHAQMENGEDTNALLLLYNTQCDPVDRHWYLHHLIRLAQRKTVDPLFKTLLEMFCWQWMVEREEICECLMTGDGRKHDHMYEVKAVNRLRIMQNGERKAQVCDIATNMKYKLPSHGWLVGMAEKYRKRVTS